jgi:deoxyribose-phosphate aldolase
MTNKEKALEVLRYIDLTSLKSTDTHYSIADWCKDINEMYAQNPDLPLIPAVCVYPCYAETVAKTLKNKDIKIASVSTGFPEGQTFEEIRFFENQNGN